jgi:hypothetical protein
MANRIAYVGLDVHKEGVVVAVATVCGARVRPDCEHSGGVGPCAAQARWRRGDAAVLLLSGGVRLWNSTSAQGLERVVVAPVADPPATWRLSQD